MLVRSTVCALLVGSSVAFAPLAMLSRQQSTSSLKMSCEAGQEDRRSFVTKTGSTAAMAGMAWATGTLGAPEAANAATNMWKPIDLPLAGNTLYDIDFDSPEHGYLVGSSGAFAETNDGGETWQARAFSNLDAEEEVQYRFQVASFDKGEGWVLGKPTLMLHTSDGGKSWERIPLSPKLPGEPTSILSLGPGKAEMTTSSGAIYVTDNAGRNWKAQVKETIDATLNRVSSSGVSGASYFTGSIINQIRDASGSYLAVSSRGNFFLTWEPGEDFWIPHNRGTPRRIQNMGFVEDSIKKGLWMTLNGGKLLISSGEPDLTNEELKFNEANIKTAGYGITDVAWKDANEVWAVGGSNTMYVSKDGGKNFVFDKSADNIPGNLYRIKFFKEFGNKGFALGSNGLLLKYVG